MACGSPLEEVLPAVLLLPPRAVRMVSVMVRGPGDLCHHPPSSWRIEREHTGTSPSVLDPWRSGVQSGLQVHRKGPASLGRPGGVGEAPFHTQRSSRQFQPAWAWTSGGQGQLLGHYLSKTFGHWPPGAGICSIRERAEEDVEGRNAKKGTNDGRTVLELAIPVSHPGNCSSQGNTVTGFHLTTPGLQRLPRWVRSYAMSL